MISCELVDAENPGRQRMRATIPPARLDVGADRYLRLQIDRPEAKSKTLQDHRAIFDAYRRKKAAQAVDLATRHIKDAHTDVMQRVKSYKRPQNDSAER